MEQIINPADIALAKLLLHCKRNQLDSHSRSEIQQVVKTIIDNDTTIDFLKEQTETIQDLDLKYLLQDILNNIYDQDIIEDKLAYILLNAASRFVNLDEKLLGVDLQLHQAEQFAWQNSHSIVDIQRNNMNFELLETPEQIVCANTIKYLTSVNDTEIYEKLSEISKIQVSRDGQNEQPCEVEFKEVELKQKKKGVLEQVITAVVDKAKEYKEEKEALKNVDEQPDDIPEAIVEGQNDNLNRQQDEEDLGPNAKLDARRNWTFAGQTKKIDDPTDDRYEKPDDQPSVSDNQIQENNDSNELVAEPEILAEPEALDQPPVEACFEELDNNIAPQDDMVEVPLEDQIKEDIMPGEEALDEQFDE